MAVVSNFGDSCEHEKMSNGHLSSCLLPGFLSLSLHSIIVPLMLYRAACCSLDRSFLSHFLFNIVYRVERNALPCGPLIKVGTSRYGERGWIDFQFFFNLCPQEKRWKGHSLLWNCISTWGWRVVIS